MYNLRTGKEYNNQQKALALLKNNDDGLTWKELAEQVDIHHGTASGVLSVLHKSGAIIRSNRIRNGCKIYFHMEYSNVVRDEPYKVREKLCPHCGNDINA